MEEKKNKKSKIIKGVALLGLFLLVFGVSYALFTVVLNGTKKNKITTGNLSLELLNESGNTLTDDTIGLENAVPMTDEEGKALTPYTFTIKNNGTIDAEYSLSLKDLPLETGEKRLDDKYVDIYMETGTGSVFKHDTCLLSDIKDRAIDAGIIKKGLSKTYKIYLWLDESAEEEAMDKVFLTSLEVNGYQVTTDTLSRSILYRKSQKKGAVTVYADGTFDVFGDKVVNIEDTSITVSNRRNLSGVNFYAYYTNLLERAGYNLSEIDVSTKTKLNSFINNTASQNETFNNLELQDMIDILKKYKVEQSVIDQFKAGEYGALYEYAETIMETDKELARKLCYEDYLMGDDNILYIDEWSKTMHFSERIEEITLPDVNFTAEVVLPSTIKKINKFVTAGKTTIPKLTIPSSVTYVGSNAFSGAQITEINILGSTAGWDKDWRLGFAYFVTGEE